MFRFFISLMMFLYLTTCNIKTIDSASVVKLHNSPKIVLITLDGVRWQEIFYGTDSNLYDTKNISSQEIIPNIYHYFVNNGVAIGKYSEIIASGTNHISLPGYLEIMRGVSTTDCITNLCEPKLDITLLDYYQEVAIFSSWETIRKSATNYPEKFIINSGRNYRTNKYLQLMTDDNQNFQGYVGHFDYRPDEFTMRATLDYLSVRKPDFLWISLGDTDEYAHAGDYSKYILSLKKADYFIGKIIQEYDENTVFIITTDHGRGEDWTSHGYDSQSARVWLMIYGKSIPIKHFVKFNEIKSLSNLMPTILKITHGLNNTNSLI